MFQHLTIVNKYNIMLLCQRTKVFNVIKGAGTQHPAKPLMCNLFQIDFIPY